MIPILWIIIAAVSAFIVYLLFIWYRIVGPSEAHIVITPKSFMVVSPDPSIQKNAGSTYFSIPSFIPFIGRKVRVMDVTIREIAATMETYEKDQARYTTQYSVKYKITDVKKAAETSVNTQDLEKQADDQIRSAVRAVTVKYSVVEARANKQKMAEEISKEITDDFSKWGLTLVMFALVDFQDTKDSQIISNISKRREVEIETDTRQVNAEKFKNAVMKEAETLEASRKREIERDQKIAERDQEKIKIVAEAEKEAREKQLEVVRVQQVKTQEIERERQVVLANQQKDVESIIKEQKKLEGEGDRAKLEEQAKGEAAKIYENLAAEAKGKDELQKALNQFGDAAIRALVAEKIVAMQQAVGIAGAAALKEADLRIFAGGSDGDRTSFDIGKAIAGLMVSNDSSAGAVINRLSRPNDLGFTDWSKILGRLNKQMEEKGTPFPPKPEEKKFPESPEKSRRYN